MGGTGTKSFIDRLTLRRYVWAAAVAWTLLVAVAATILQLNEENQATEQARAIVHTALHVNQQWARGMMGAEFSDSLQLEGEEKNPSWPDTTFMHLFPIGTHDSLSMRGRLTSLTPRRPENAPDDWERESLAGFERGEKEATTIAKLHGVLLIRYIGALRTKESCLRCHNGSNDRPGSILGGMSISVPLEPFRATRWAHAPLNMLSFVALWAVGLVGLAVGNTRFKQRIKERDRAIEERVRAQIARQRMESALQESEERYHRIIETIQEGIWEIDTQGNTVFVNQRMARMLGCSTEQMKGRSIFDFTDEKGRVEAERLLEGSKAGVAEQHDLRLRRSDGSDLWTIVSTNPVVDADGKFSAMLAMVIDISRRKAAEEALSVSESRYRALFEDNMAGVYRTNLDGVILDCNVAIARLLGYASPDELKKHSAREFYFDPSDRQEFLAALLRTGSLTSYSMRFRRRDGTPVWVLENVTFDGSIIQGTIVDVTAHREAVEALHESEERLRLEKMRSHIAADLHDEIGSTLSSISVFDEMLRQEIGDASPKSHQLLRRIDANLHEAQDALHEIVWSINPENDALENLLLMIVQRATELLEARGIHCDFVLPAEPAAINIPLEKRRQIYLVMKEALSNLVKHSACTQASIRVETHDRVLTLTLQDNGKGFNRNAIRPGNGLRNMESRAVAIGGTLSVVSGGTLGTTITLRVPVA